MVTAVEHERSMIAENLERVRMHTKTAPGEIFPQSNAVATLERAGAREGLARYRGVVRVVADLTPRSNSVAARRFQLTQERTDLLSRRAAMRERAGMGDGEPRPKPVLPPHVRGQVSVSQAGGAADWQEAEQRRFDGELAEIDARLTALGEENAAVSRRLAPAEKLVRAIERHVGSGAPLKPVDPPSVPKGATLDTVRANGAKLTADYAEWFGRACDTDSVQARIRAQCKNLARTPSIKHMFDRASDRGGIFFPTVGLAAPAPDGKALPASVPDSLGLIFYLFGEQIAEQMCVEARRLGAETNGVDDATRAKRLEEIAAEILVNERLEAAICAAMLRRGEEVILRAPPDVAPGDDERASRDARDRYARAWLSIA
jgi:hypothetical protein